MLCLRWESRLIRHEVWLRQRSHPGLETGRGRPEVSPLPRGSAGFIHQHCPSSSPAEWEGEQLLDPIQGEQSRAGSSFKISPNTGGKRIQ